MAPTPDIVVAVTPNVDSNKNRNGYVNAAFENESAQNGGTNNAFADIVLTNLEDSNTLEKNQVKNADVAAGSKSADVDFDDMLPHIGEFGRYQKILFFLMIPFAFFVAFVYFAQIFMTLVPERHWCRIDELQHLPLNERLSLGIPKENNVFDKCSRYAVNFTEILAAGVKEPDPNWLKIPCDNGWEFDTEEIPYSTISTELEWVCENGALPSIAQSIFFCGAIVGGLLFGWIADRYGRIPALVGSNLFGLVGGILTAFSNTFVTFTLCRFIVGFAFDNCFTMMYILVLEYVGPKWRTFVANMSIAIFFTFAACLLPYIALGVANWRYLAIATSAPLALAILTPWLVPESARWLVSQGQSTKAISILRRFEKINRVTIQPEVYTEFSQTCERLAKEEEANSSYSILDLFRTPRLRSITVLFIIIWMCISITFDGHVRNVGGLGLNVFHTFAIAAATELPADVLLTYTLDIVGRRWMAFGSMVFSGVFSLLATSFEVGLNSAILAIMGRFWVNISYNIGLQYAAEVLPTVVRAQGITFIHIMGYFATIIAPFVVYLSYISPIWPLLILGCVGIFGGVLSLFLPETMDQLLPQTLADGEEFGRNQKFLDFPCCSSQKKSNDTFDFDSFERGVMRHSVGASLRASSRGELGSNMLHRRSFGKTLSLKSAETIDTNNKDF